MLRRVRAELIAATLDPRAPHEAAKQVVSRAIAHAPNRRRFWLARLDETWCRAVAPTPWLARGLAAAIDEHGGTQPEPIDLRAHIQVHEHDLGGRIELASPTGDTTWQLPRRCIGDNLIVVVPLVHRFVGRTRVGPAALVADALQRNCSRGSMVSIDVRPLLETFAHATLIVDATWWTPVGPRGRRLAAPRCVGHCLATTHWRPRALAAIDAWLAARLGFTDLDASELTVTGELGAWPHVHWPPRSRPVPPHRRLRSRPQPRIDPTRGPFGPAWVQSVDNR